jgi:hypothetical protein
MAAESRDTGGPMMGKITFKGFVPSDDPMFKQGPSMFTQPKELSLIASNGPIDREDPMSKEHQQPRYRTGVRGVESITDNVLLDAARSLIKGDLHVGKDRARRYIVFGTDGPIIRDLTGAQVAEFMVSVWRYYTKNGSIHMGQRFLFCDIKKRDLSL